MYFLATNGNWNKQVGRFSQIFVFPANRVILRQNMKNIFSLFLIVFLAAGYASNLVNGRKQLSLVFHYKQTITI